MTKTTYFEKSTGKNIEETEFFERLNNNDADVDSITECLDCGKTILPHEVCSCSHVE